MRRRKGSSASSPTRSPAATSSRPRSGPVRRPSAADLAAARNRRLRDVIAPGLKVLFCGINPGLYSGATGHHFARPGNRFWPALYGAGFTPRLLHPAEQAVLLRYGCGVTNLVNRVTATADELSPAEFVAGRRRLIAKVRLYRPRTVAFLGVGAYCHAFGLRRAALGLQAERLAGSRVWLLPNPSGLNASYQLPGLVRLFKSLKQAADRDATTDRAACRRDRRP